MLSNREWMYTKRLIDGIFNPEWPQYVKHFLEFAYANATNIQCTINNGEEIFEIRCPCTKCKNRLYKVRTLIRNHLIDRGFMKNYSLWHAHGELYPTQEMRQCSNPIATQHEGQCSNTETAPDMDYRRYEEMVIETMHQPKAFYYQQTPQQPNLEAQKFYKILKQASEPLWDGCTNASTLSTTTRLLDWKSQSNVSDTSFNNLLSIVKDILPPSEKLPDNIYETKKMFKLLQLPSQRIHIQGKREECSKFGVNIHPGANGKTGRHTGGSIGNTDHRRKLDSYMRGLSEKYGDDPTKHVHDVDVWNMSQLQRQKGTHKGRMYGIGTADSQFLFTGLLSVGGDSSHYVQNEEVERLRNEMDSMREAEAQREARDTQRELEMEEMQKKHALLEAQMTDFFKQNNFSGNPPQRN
ncbi:unnamed protein product [Lactuca saligna]|uniref:Transposase-associated domain-containing protein n=1 Tax=Lactuca saligna TaxID=75948 RepID=A0AA35Z323_LACSI|nr:unnamed protein product [Lactuca saligna]